MDSIHQFLEQIQTAGGSALGLWQAFLFFCVAYLGGVLASLTPCVYPMIPITIGVVGGLAQKDDTRKRHRWREVGLRGLVYVSGMTVVYSVLGVIAGLTGRIFGTLTNSEGWYLGLGAIFVLASLVMLNVLPFDPVVWLDQLKRKLGLHRRPETAAHKAHVKKELNLVGAFTLGMTSGFIATPCTTPVLTAVLAYIAKTQSVGLGFILMVGFSAGLSTLLLLIAFFAGSLQTLPKSGKWMNAVKIGSGLILLGFANYLFYRAGTLGGN